MELVFGHILNAVFSSEYVKKAVGDYIFLVKFKNLNESQMTRFQEILDDAGENSEIEFWISEIDHLAAHQLDLLGAEYIARYENEQAILEEAFDHSPYDMRATSIPEKPIPASKQAVMAARKSCRTCVS